MLVSDTKGLVSMINSGEAEIMLEADLGKKIVRIRATNKVAVIAAVGLIAVSIVAVAVPPAVVVTPPLVTLVAPIAAAPAVTLAFGTAAPTAVSLAIAAKYARILLRIRDYDIKKVGGHYVAKRKK